MTHSNDYLGFDFSGTIDVQEEKKEFTLLKAGNYILTIKDVEMSKTKEDKQKLIVYFETENGISIKKDYVIPDENAKDDDFKKLNLKNLLSRVLYSNLTKEEFNSIPFEEVNRQCSNLKGMEKLINKFIGVKVTAEIDQVPFISKKKETNALTGISESNIQFTDLVFQTVMSNAPLKIKNLFKESNFDHLPVLKFSNDIMPKSIGFANNYKEGIKKDSLSKVWYDSLVNKIFKSNVEEIEEEWN